MLAMLGRESKIIKKLGETVITSKRLVFMLFITREMQAYGGLFLQQYFLLGPNPAIIYAQVFQGIRYYMIYGIFSG